MYIHLHIHIQGMKFCKLNHDCREVYIYIYIVSAFSICMTVHLKNGLYLHILYKYIRA